MERYLILALVVILGLFLLVDEAKAAEMYMVDSVGTKVIITDEYCLIQEALQKMLVSRAYAIDKHGKKYEGCWAPGDMSDAPKSTPQKRIAPVVNISFGNGIHAFLLEWFRPEPSPDFPLEGETWI
jgi:hypothetical protein